MRLLLALSATMALATAAVAQTPPAKMPPFSSTGYAQGVVIYDKDGNVVSSFGGGAGGGGATGSVTPAGTNGTAAQSIQGINGGVNVGVSATSWPLPTNAATAAAQATGNASLASIDGKTPALVGGRQPVDGSGVTQPVSLPAGAQTTTGALEPPTAAAGKITRTSTALTANTSTTIAAANAGRIALGLQCGSGGVSVDEAGGTLTAAGVGNGTLFIPTGTGPYFSPPVATRTALTAYTATAQTCVVTEYLR